MNNWRQRITSQEEAKDFTAFIVGYAHYFADPKKDGRMTRQQVRGMEIWNSMTDEEREQFQDDASIWLRERLGERPE